MDGERPLLVSAFAGLAAGVFLLALGVLARAAAGDSIDFTGLLAAHGAFFLLGFLLPALLWLHAHTLARLARLPEAAGRALMWPGHALFFIAATAASAQAMGAPWLLGLSWLAALAVCMPWTVQVFKHKPGSLVDTDTDLLTKGDDACMKHVAFAHRLLPLGLLLLAAAAFLHQAALGGVDVGLWPRRMDLTGMHVLLVGFGLLSLYGLGHFWIPRFSGVPAIAAGAIKGELHTTLLGLVGLVAGFLVGFDNSVGRGFLVGLGPFVFLGFFVYMGVLGANIMKNKSRTQRVTPEFVYIPWTFAATFWLVCGVLMGVFLNAVPDVLAHRADDLRFTHLHIALLGGAAQYWMGWLTRLLPREAGMAPPRFQGPVKGSFYALNASVALAVWGRFLPSPSWQSVLALLLLALSLALFFRSMRRYMPAPALPPRA